MHSHKKIGLFSATMVVMGTIIGSGVFKKISPMTLLLGNEALVHLCWILAGIVTMWGALTFAELGSRLPKAGGIYSYLHAGFGPTTAFFYGWGSFSVMQSGSFASMSYVFAESMTSLFNINHPLASKIIASLTIIFLTVVNYRGISLGAFVQNLFTMGKMLGLMLVTAIGFWLWRAPFDWQSTQFGLTHELPRLGVGVMFSGMLSAFWAYDGICNIGFIGEEIKDPEKNIPRALIFGVLGVIAFYLIINFSYYRALEFSQVQKLAIHSDSIFAIEMTKMTMGSLMAIVVTLFIGISTFGCANGSILASSRIYYAMARDGMFFKSWARLHPQFHSPHRALVGQGLWGILLIFTGSFDELTDRLIFASFIFYFLAALAVWRIRKKNIGEAKYTVPNWVALCYAMFCGSLVIIIFFRETTQALSGVGLVLIGYPVYRFVMRAKA